MVFFGEFGRSSKKLGESDYDLIKSRDDRLNSSKSGMWIFGDRNTGCPAWNRGDVLRGAQEMSSLEHRRCPAWNTQDVLRGTQEMSCVENRRCSAWNTRDVLLRTHEMSCVEHTRCPAWSIRDVLPGTHEMLCVRAYVHTYVPLIRSTIVESPRKSSESSSDSGSN